MKTLALCATLALSVFTGALTLGAHRGPDMSLGAMHNRAMADVVTICHSEVHVERDPASGQLIYATSVGGFGEEVGKLPAGMTPQGFCDSYGKY